MDVAGEIVSFLAPYPGTSPFTAEEKAELVQHLRDEYVRAFYKLDDGKYLGKTYDGIPVSDISQSAIYRCSYASEKELYASLELYHRSPNQTCFVFKGNVWERRIKKTGRARITNDEIFDLYEETMRKIVAYEGPCACGKTRVFKNGLCHECFMNKIPEMRKAANSRKRQRE